jgi:DNA-binding XRE family transcriptional regulator
MSKRKPMDKAQARERRDRMLASAAAADLSLTEGVREMRAIAGMTQEEFARHRGVSARVIKAIELGQGNPTVATMNRIGQFFGLEVAFVPIRRAMPAGEQPQPARPGMSMKNDDDDEFSEAIRQAIEKRMEIAVRMRELNEMVAELDNTFGSITQLHKNLENMTVPSPVPAPVKSPLQEKAARGEAPPRKKAKPGSP